MSEIANYLPDYTIRRSKRAKRISMRIIPDQGLELVLPEGVSERAGLRFLKAHRGWIAEHAEMLMPEAIALEQQRYRLVETIQLRCVNELYPVRYLQVSTGKVKLACEDQVLIFSGKIKDMRDCEDALKDWLKHKARLHLIPLLDRLSELTGLQHRGVSIRYQQTRWGSCSEKGDISLNARLLYQPRDVVRYVLIHELCHLQEMNHSRAFWRLVERFEPQYRLLRGRLG